MIARWLQAVLALVALGGLLALGGCGGGSGAPNNPFNPPPPAPGPLFILPAAATVYSNTPTTLTITGGAAPFFIVSSNTAVLPVAQNSINGDVVLLPGNVTADTVVLITAQDAIGQRASSTVTVKAAPIFNTLVIKPSSAACGANTICSGQTGTATVTVTGPGGVGIPNRQVQFEVVDGDFAIQSNNPATPLVSTLTVVSDGVGVATVVIQANVGVATQPAFIRATELISGNHVTGQFTIVQTNNGSAVLSVVPPTATITGAFVNECLGGFAVDYFIFGGTPPYHVSNTFPTTVTLVNTTVGVSGGSFRAITTTACVNPAIFSIVDASGLQTTATLINLPGTATPTPPPVTPPNVFATPGSIDATVTLCEGNTFNFAIAGGTPPYNMIATGTFGTNKVAPVPSPQTLAAAGIVQVSGLHDGFPNASHQNRYDFTVIDSLGTSDGFSVTCQSGSNPI
ncbi:MAG: hypothetical protein ACHP7M_11750 [Burkholderiales bacterium]